MLKELFGTFVGQLSLAVLLFIIVMAVYFYKLFVRKMNEAPAQD